MATENPKLVKLRALFADSQVTGHSKPIQAYVLPRTDAHQSEYINDRDNRVQYLSGFSGSNAYTAPKELEPGWKLMKQGQPDSVEPVDWITDNVPPSSSVGFDPSLFGYSDGKSLIQKLTNARIEPVPIVKNLVDVIWDSRPPEEIHTLIALKPSEHGEASSAKIERVREKLRKKKCDAIILTALDDIAWLFNVRGADIPYNPLFFSVAAVTLDKVFLFMDERKLDDEVRPELQLATILPYEAAVEWLRKYHADMAEKYPESHKIWVPSNTNYYIGSVVNEKYAYVDSCPVALMKAIKNEVELAGMRYAHVRDSAAHVQFLVWLRREVELGHIVDEVRAEKQIDYYRSRLPGYVSLSFPTISAADEHAAQPHYHMTEESGKKVVTKDSVFLVDSGGHYRDGTTDVTRTVSHGESPDEYFKKMFTLVLKCHIDLATANFPDGVGGIRLEAFARNALWAQGYDFGHGVGHGVGHFLNVHQNPPYVGYRITGKDDGVKKAMVVTIEPGYYEEGRFGIRIENCYEIVEAKNLASGASNYLTFSPLTLVPIQKNLIVREMLDPKHIQWLNTYHNRCLEVLGKYLQEQSLQDEYNFLAESCTPV